MDIQIVREDNLIDISHEETGALFFCNTVESRLEYRKRRQLEIDFLSQQLLSYKYTYDFEFPGWFFDDAIRDAELEKDEAMTLRQHIARGGLLRVPVFIRDERTPAAHSEVTDGEGGLLEVMNRFEAARLWGPVAAGDLMGTAAATVDFANEAVPVLSDRARRASERVAETMRDDERWAALTKVLMAMAWIDLRPTGRRAEHYEVPSCCELATGQDPSTNKGLFYRGIPTPPCSIETVAFRAMAWAAEEASYRMRSSDGDGDALYQRVLSLVKVARAIQQMSSDSRHALRDVDRECDYDVVFTETCPVVMPLMWIRGYAKMVDDRGAAGGRAPLAIMEEYLTCCETYLEVVYDLVVLMVEFARARADEDDEDARRDYALRARRLLHAFTNVREMPASRRTIAVMNVRPYLDYTVKVNTLLTALSTSPRTQHKEQVQRTIQQQIIAGGTANEYLADQVRWNRRVKRVQRALKLRRNGWMWLTRGLWQQGSKLNAHNLRYPEKRRGGFLITKFRGRELRARRYPAVPLSSHDTPDFFTGDCQTQHIVVDLEGTELEIRPAATFVKQPHAVLGARTIPEKNKRSRAEARIAELERAMRAAQERGDRQKAESLKGDLAEATIGERWRKAKNRERRKSYRCPIEEVFGNVYLSDDLQWARFYSTKTEEELKAQRRGLETSSVRGTAAARKGLLHRRARECEMEAPYNARLMRRIGRKPSLVKPGWHLDWHLMIGLRLRKEIRTAFTATITAFLVGLAASLVVFGLKGSSTVASAVAYGTLGLMAAVITFFLSSDYSHIFTNYAARWHRGTVYSLAAMQLVLVLVMVFVGIKI